MTRGEWAGAAFDDSEADVYPPALLEREQWMGAAGEDGKQPFALWGDRDAPTPCTKPEHDAETTAECDCDARWKWGYTEHYVDGETVAMAEDDPRLDGRVYLQQESDPFAFVDGDDVRDPETEEVHPAFVAILEHLGLTYADISTSGSGVHAYYTGDLPIDGEGQATFDLDTEPWGANEDVPSVEFYANKHVNRTTGQHVPGTPLDIADWDADALRAILQANGYEDKSEVSHDSDRDRADLEEYEADATAADETTTEVRDVLKAVDRLRPRDVRLRTRETGADATGWATFDPHYRSSESGESLHSPPDSGVFHDHKEGESFGVLGLLAAEEDIISEPWDRLAGGDWWEAVEAAREMGADIPEYVGGRGHESEPVAVLPPAVREFATTTSGWDWRHAGEHRAGGVTVEGARERTVEAIADSYTRGDRVLVEALPTMGKSYGSIKAAAETGEEISIVTGRGRKEQYEQFREWADDLGLSHYTLPSFTHDCDTANGEHGDEWAETVRDWYRRGATPKEIHKAAEYVLGEPLPCQRHEGQRCPYASKWDFEPGEFDVLIGHYNHAHKAKVTNGRVVVFDEFPDAYETTLFDQRLQSAVSYWLSTVDAIPFDDYTDLIEHRHDAEQRAGALSWFLEHDVEPAEGHVFDDPHAHAAAPLAVFTLLAGEDMGNGFEHADLEGAGTGAFDRSAGEVSVLKPPDLTYASGVVALDGTPTMDMWRLALGEHLNHRQVLQTGERAEYIREALNLQLVRTTEAIKPYNSADHVTVEQDAALLEKIRDEYGERPSVITTSTAEGKYDVEDVLDEHVDRHKHFGNVLGSNEFDDERLGAVIGSNHYGDRYVKKWGAYAGVEVERDEGKGAALSYGGFGDEVLTHMREHETLQAAMRFGRDGNGAVVHVHTNTLPDWAPIAAEARVLRTWSQGMRQVLEAAEEFDTWTTADLADHPTVEVGERQVLNILQDLAERDVVDWDVEGRGFVWEDGGLRRVSEHGEVELEPVDLDDVSDETVHEIGRSSTHTWSFVNMATRGEETPGGSGVAFANPRGDAVDRGDAPPPGD